MATSPMLLKSGNFSVDLYAITTPGKGMGFHLNIGCGV